MAFITLINSSLKNSEVLFLRGSCLVTKQYVDIILCLETMLNICEPFFFKLSRCRNLCKFVTDMKLGNNFGGFCGNHLASLLDCLASISCGHSCNNRRRISDCSSGCGCNQIPCLNFILKKAFTVKKTCRLILHLQKE